MKFITAAVAVSLAAGLLILPAKAQEQLTPKSAQAALAANPDGEAGAQGTYSNVRRSGWFSRLWQWHL